MSFKKVLYEVDCANSAIDGRLRQQPGQKPESNEEDTSVGGAKKSLPSETPIETSSFTQTTFYPSSTPIQDSSDGIPTFNDFYAAWMVGKSFAGSAIASKPPESDENGDNTNPWTCANCKETGNGMDSFKRHQAESPDIHEQADYITDVITSPIHYTKGIETWDYIISHGLGYLEGNIIKYVTRYQLKNGREDLLKAQAYLNRLLKEVPEEDK